MGDLKYVCIWLFCRVCSLVLHHCLKFRGVRYIECLMNYIAVCVDSGKIALTNDGKPKAPRAYVKVKAK